MKPLITVRTRSGILAAGLAMALFGHLPAGLAANYQVSGSVIRDYVKPDGSDGTLSNWFRVAVSGCRSSITAGALAEPRVEFYEYRCDGTNSSFLVKFVRNDRKRVANEATLTLNSGPVPEYNLGMVSEVWLAYASACFYERLLKGRTEPVFLMGMGFREHHLMVKSEWKLTTTAPPLLDRMCDFSDGFRYNEQDNTLLKERLPSPFDQGSTNAVYSVLQWTNYGGLTLPSKWQVIKYKPNLHTGRLERAMTTRGYTASVDTSETGTNFAPLLPKNTYVTDNTLEAQGSPVRSHSYLTTNGQLRSLAVMARDPGFQQALQDAKKGQSLPGKRRLVVIIETVLILFPLVFLVHRYWRGRSNEKRQQETLGKAQYEKENRKSVV